MNKFRWPLQRLLDVASSQEESVRNDLVAIAGKITVVRRAMKNRLSVLQNLLVDLANKDPHQRINDQHTWMTCCPGVDHRYLYLRNQEHLQENLRQKKTAELMEIRRSRQKLESLKEDSRKKYHKQILKIEQKQSDESSATRFSHFQSPTGNESVRSMS